MKLKLALSSSAAISAATVLLLSHQIGGFVLPAPLSRNPILPSTAAATAKGLLPAPQQLQLQHHKRAFHLVRVPASSTGGELENSEFSQNTKEDDVNNSFSKTSSSSSSPSSSTSSTMEVIKSAGAAGALAYGLTELAFWAGSIPLAIYTYYMSTGEILHINDPADQAKIAGLSVGFLGVARLVVPLRIALAAALTPFVQKNITSKWKK